MAVLQSAARARGRRRRAEREVTCILRFVVVGVVVRTGRWLGLSLGMEGLSDGFGSKMEPVLVMNGWVFIYSSSVPPLS